MSLSQEGANLQRESLRNGDDFGIKSNTNKWPSVFSKVFSNSQEFAVPKILELSKKSQRIECTVNFNPK